MKKSLLVITLSGMGLMAFAQSGHLMQGVGAANMSMGGASTAQPIDINGALQWNPAATSAFKNTIVTLDAGVMFSAPKLYSTVPTPGGPMSGESASELGPSVLPSLGLVFGKESSKHTFGFSAFGVSGFGVDFPESTTNPINMPQNQGGFGHLESSYMMLQLGASYSYAINDKLSIGIQPTFNYSALQVKPNPLASPSQTLGEYPNSDNASATGYGGQIGVFYDSQKGIKLGASYKTEQSFSEFNFKGTFSDGSAASETKFTMNFPAIASVGIGYSNDLLDLALDYRRVFYSATEGFEKSGWSIGANGYPTGAVAGFGWKDINIISAGVQLKVIEKIPLRVGYTYNSNPIDPELAMYSVSAPAIIEHAIQLGVGFNLGEKLTINTTYHHGFSAGKTTGSMLSPMAISPSNPNGAIPNSEVAYDMTTDMFIIGLSYTFK